MGTPSVGTDQPEECWEEEERLNCALRAFFGARSGGDPFGGLAKSIWNMNNWSAMTGIISSEFFTESLILAQNERWRRV